MKIDRAWLVTIDEGERMIPKISELINRLPEGNYRNRIRHQFRIVTQEFKGNIRDGYHPRHSLDDLLQIGKLVVELLDEAA